LDLVKNDRGESIGTFFVEASEKDHFEFIFERGRGRKREIKQIPVLVSVQ
jgi:hypothetical protein